MTLSCGHSFHGCCILEHFKYKTSCPLCRTEHCLIKKSDNESGSDGEDEDEEEDEDEDEDEEDEDEDEENEYAEIYKEKLFELFLKIKEIEDNLSHAERSARTNNLWKRGGRLSFNIYSGEENFTEMFINFCSIYNIVIGYNKVSKLWNGYHTISDTQKFNLFVNFMSDSNIHVYFTTGEAEQSMDLDYELFCAVL